MSDLLELAAALEHHAALYEAADNGKPHWDDQISDFNLRTAYLAIAPKAIQAAPAIKQALGRIEELEQERAELKRVARRRADIIIEDRDIIEGLKAKIEQLENPWQEGVKDV